MHHCASRLAAKQATATTADVLRVHSRWPEYLTAVAPCHMEHQGLASLATCPASTNELPHAMSLVPTNASSSRKSATSREIHALQEAIQSFRSSLSDKEQAELQHAQQDDIAADTNAAITFTAKLDRSRSSKGPSIASRLHNVLQSVWEFSTIVDTFVSSHPEVAALVWGSMKLTMKVQCPETTRRCRH